VNEPTEPLKLQHAAIQHSIDQTRVNLDKNKELSNLLKEVRKKCTKEINALLGSKAKEYREFLEKRRENARTMQPLFTATPEGRKAKSQFQKTRLDEENEFMKSLGINVNDFKLILSKYQEESKSIIEKTRTVEGSLKLEVGSIPEEVVHPDPGSPWHSIHPPYFYSHGDVYILWDSGLSVGPTRHYARPEGSHYENNLTGEISCNNSNVILYSFDHETQLVQASSIILIYFQMPASGRLNIWSQWQCVESSYGGSLFNESGSSDATTMQSSSLFMMVGEQLGIEEAYFQLLDDQRHTSDNVEWSGNMVMPGEYRTFNLATDLSYSAGQGILLRAGIFNFDNVVLGNMTYHGRIKNSWILHGVWVSAFNP
jgi:hypothetical protein